MPELPEVETLARQLRQVIEGARLEAVRILGSRVVSGRLPEVRHRRVERVERYGKWLVLVLDEGCLVLRLGMTGVLRWQQPCNAYTRAILEFPTGSLCFQDVRQFGSLSFSASFPEGLGPDALEISASELAGLVRGRARSLKALLLDQSCLRGLGNIYVDEVLFRAGLHPLTPACALSAGQIRRLRDTLGEVLRRAIELGGSSVSDFVDLYGRPGRYQFEHQVYRRAGLPCVRCGEPVRRILVAQRGTHVCERCQPLICRED